MTTTEFDPYIPSTWLTNGFTLTIPHKADVAKPVKRDAPVVRMMRSVASASMVAVGMAVASVPFTAQYAAAAEVLIKQRSGQFQFEDDEVPEGYWVKMAELQRRLPSLPDDDSDSDPPPLG